MVERHSEAVVAKYAQVDDKLYMSVDEAVALSLEIAFRLRSWQPRPDYVVGIANGALLMTRVIADELGCPMAMISFRRRGSRLLAWMSWFPPLKHLLSRLYDVPACRRPMAYLRRSLSSLSKQQTGRDALDVSGRLVALIDDCVETGQSASAAKALLTEKGAREVITCCISWSRAMDSVAIHGVKPDIYISRRLQHYPWSLNSPFQDALRRWLADAELKPNP